MLSHYVSPVMDWWMVTCPGCMLLNACPTATLNGLKKTEKEPKLLIVSPDSPEPNAVVHLLRWNKLNPYILQPREPKRAVPTS